MGSVVTFILLCKSSLFISGVEILYCKCLEQQKKMKMEIRCRPADANVSSVVL